MALRAPGAARDNTRGNSELESESEIHAKDASMEQDDEEGEADHPFHAFHAEFLKGDPNTARDAFRGMLSTVEDDGDGDEPPSLLDSFRRKK